MPSIWAIADLHLSFSVPNKKMDVFGHRWKNHEERVKKAWLEQITPEDLILIAGDISWAKNLSDALVDLTWIHELPGTKLLLKGNHDYWWTSPSQLKKALPSSLHLIQNDVFHWQGVSIGGSRLWDTPEYTFDAQIEESEVPAKKKAEMHHEESPEETEKIFSRELLRLEMSLKCFAPNATHRIAMTHYPPIGPDLAPSRASALLEKYKVDTCVFGHIHSVIPNAMPMGMARGVTYHHTACDYLNCIPLKILTVL